ncbi:MAG TPA: glycosyltransferase family 39 protein [Candidatus Acidoferrales bacterium]|nr:glycosyltransferase family 39 protein [Candidatus Acidoferrales bacterium]
MEMERPALLSEPSRGFWPSLWPWLILAVVLILAGAIRLRLLNVPLERDEGEYAYLGQLLLQAIPPYELVYSMKLPGTGFVYMLGMALFGQSTAGIHLTLLVANSLTTVFVFLLGRQLAGCLAGLVAAASYGVMSASPAVAGLAAHATHFVVLFAVPATSLLLKPAEPKRPALLFASGLLFGLAFLMKQQGLCFGLFAAVFLSCRAWRSRTLFTASFFKTISMFAAGLALPVALTCAALASVGEFGRLWFWTVSYARLYEGSLTLRQGLHEHLLQHLQQTRDVSIGFWILAIAGLLAAWRLKRLRPAMLFSLGFWLFSFLGAAAGLYFRGHYFILVLPAFAILLGLAVAALREIMPVKILPDVFKSLPLIAFGIILAWMVFYYAPLFFQWPADKVGQQLYRQEPFAEAVAAAALIREHSAPSARLAVIGSEPEIYFYARRHSATGYIYTYPLMEDQPYARVMQQEMAREIESAQPEYLVQVPYALSWLQQPHSSRYLADWFEDYAGKFYQKVGTVGFLPGGRLATSWGLTATNAPALAGEFITIFQRRR